MPAGGDESQQILGRYGRGLVVGQRMDVDRIMGHQGLGWEEDAFTPEELAATRLVLSSKAGGIAGGSQEVQWNIISKRILGLPDLTTH